MANKYKVFKPTSKYDEEYKKELENLPVISSNTVNRIQILRNATIPDGQIVTIYTVPSGYRLFITAVYLTVSETVAVGVSDINCSISIGYPFGTNNNRLIHLSCVSNATVGSFANQSLSFSIPIVVDQNQTIQGVEANVGTATAGFIGFLEPRILSNQIST